MSDDELIAEADRILRGEGIGFFATAEARRKAAAVLATAGIPPLIGDGVADDTAALQARADRGLPIPGQGRTYRITAPIILGRLVFEDQPGGVTG